MPWCEPCSRFLSPATVTADGRCPSCGRAVDPGRGRSPTGVAPAVVAPVVEGPAVVAPVAVTPVAEEPGRRGGALPPIPWHFKLLCGAASVYLGWRAVQGIGWLVAHV
jgi:hypothetical protein